MPGQEYQRRFLSTFDVADPTWPRSGLLTTTSTWKTISISKSVFDNIKESGMGYLLDGTTSRSLLCHRLVAAK